jgi:hypothetical protein
MPKKKGTEGLNDLVKESDNSMERLMTLTTVPKRKSLNSLKALRTQVLTNQDSNKKLWNLRKLAESYAPPAEYENFLKSELQAGRLPKDIYNRLQTTKRGYNTAINRAKNNAKIQRFTKGTKGRVKPYAIPSTHRNPDKELYNQEGSVGKKIHYKKVSNVKGRGKLGAKKYA